MSHTPKKRHNLRYYSQRWVPLGRMLANPLSPGGEVEEGWACRNCGKQWPLSGNPGATPCENNSKSKGN